jgi:CBS domain containing-hemolysin-like protein
VYLALLLFLLLASAFFSGAETALFSLRRAELAEMQRLGGPAGRRVAALVAQAHQLLPGILIGNLVVNTLVGVVGTSLAIAWLGPPGVTVAVPAITLALLVCGEITPKLLALRMRRRFALMAQAPLAAWLALIRPVLAASAAATEALLRALPYERTGTRPFTVAELDLACDLAVEAGTLTETEGRFLARLLGIQRLEAWRVMTPRTDVVTLDVAMTRAEILAVGREAGFNRYPVMADEKPLPIGFFHLKDLLARADDERPLARGLRAAYFVPESKEVAELLTDLRTTARHLAVVIDEHGDFTGIVTLDDCLQALTGPIGDETDRDDSDVFRVGDRSWVVAGRVTLTAVEETCGIALPPSPHYATVAGLVMARLGRIPRRGDRVEMPGTVLSVLEMIGVRVARVRVERLGTEGDGG